MERGITLDLGFSSFVAPLPERLRGAPFSGLQVTLVDCPGHASLIRTIVGGASIVDTLVLVVDATKGLQTQTAECLVIGELTTDKLVVALNKVDLLPAEGREAALAKLSKRLAAVLSSTRFAGCAQVCVSARPGGGEGAAAQGLEELVSAVLALVEAPPPAPVPPPPLLLAVDHCFTVRGQGTVLTGTVLRGRLVVGQTVELPALRLSRKVKSLQAFHQPVSEAGRGDRVGVCLVQFDSKLMERGLVCEPGSVPTFSRCVAAVEKIRFFKGPLPSKLRLHVSIGHSTVMAELSFFRGPAPTPAAGASQLASQLDQLSIGQRAASFSLSHEYEAMDELRGAQEEGEAEAGAGQQRWALLVFDSPVVAQPDALIIGSRLDFDTATSSCRLALHGRVAALVDPESGPQPKIFKRKQREGTVERWESERSCVGRGMFKKETDIRLFENMRVQTGSGREGFIVGAFGKSGKYKCTFPGGVPEEECESPETNRLVLRFRRFVGDKRMTQD